MQNYKYHAHSQRLFAAGFRLLKRMIQDKCYTRKVSEILQQGKERKENGHRRQHD